MRSSGSIGRWGIWVLALLVCVIAASVFAHRELQTRLKDGFARDGQSALALYSEMTSGWLNRYRALAPIYARDPTVFRALRAPQDSTAIGALNRDLEIWNAVAGTADTYVMTTEGLTIAASNWADARTFVGQNFSFRPYFIEPMEGRLGRFFGLGTTSGLRGYYFGAPVRDGDRIIGVVAVKIAVEALEQEFRLNRGQVFVTDGAGVIILAGDPAFVLKTLGPLTNDQRSAIDAVQQFDVSRLSPAPIETRPSTGADSYETVIAPADRSGSPSTEFLHLTTAMPPEGWTLHLLTETDTLREQLWTYSMLGAAVLLSIALGAAVMLQRRWRLLERLADRERARTMLAHRVEERTSELRAANLQLREEVAERKAAEDNLRKTQSELVQAGKLAALGQMSAALSHEFNQPLTAIRTYAENAMAFVDSGSGERANENMSRIMRLTERMAQLSRHLTRFARRSQDVVEPVALDHVLDETLSLLQGRIEKADAEIRVTGATGLLVLGGQVRLQHVFMNLIGNALDAMTPGRRPEISVHVAERDGRVEIVVEDNGGGIPADALPRIFDPFFTTKEVGKGLGLGLSISFNIVRDFGGLLTAMNRPEGGARFVVTLVAAEAQRREVAE